MRTAILLTAALPWMSAPALGETPARTVSAAEVVELAKAHSPVLRTAILELERARLAVEGEEHRYRPTYTADVGYLRSSSPTMRSDGVSVGSSDEVALGMGVAHQLASGMQLGAQLDLDGEGRNYAAPNLDEPLRLGTGYGASLRLSAAQPLLRGFGADYGEAELRVARHQRTAAQYAQERSASEVVREVLTAYWELWYAQMAAAIQRGGLEATRRELDDAEQRADAGALARLEVLPLRTEVASVSESVLSAELDVERKRIDLARLVGIPLVGRSRLSADPKPPTGPDEVQAEEEVVAAARESAYELAELASSVAQAQVQAVFATQQAKPKLDAETWVTVAGLGNGDIAAAAEMLGTFEAVSAFAGLSLELPVDTTLLETGAARARLAAAAAGERLRDATERVAAEAVDLRARLWTTRERLGLSEQTAVLEPAPTWRGRTWRCCT